MIAIVATLRVHEGKGPDLESTFKGLDVEVVHRGVSGELAADAAERIKTEVALNDADLVLWQLGTADALAQVPVAAFYVTVTQTSATTITIDGRMRWGKLRTASSMTAKTWRNILTACPAPARPPGSGAPDGMRAMLC